jgi:hypothetical protein
MADTRQEEKIEKKLTETVSPKQDGELSDKETESISGGPIYVNPHN